MIFYFNAVRGLMQWSNQRALFDFLLAHEGEELYAKLDKFKNVRSLSQNALYHAYLEIISNETGNEVDSLHKLFKGLLLPKKEITLKGKTYILSGSTTELTKAEMIEYMDKICAMTEVPIPDPKLMSIEKSVAYPKQSNITAF